MTNPEREDETAPVSERPPDPGDLPELIPVSPGLELRRIVPADAPRLFEVVRDNPDVTAHVAWAVGVESAADVLPALRRVSDERLAGRFVIAADGDVVGYVGIHPGAEAGEFGIGYFLDRAARGRGYVTDAVGALLEQAAAHLGARRFYCQIKPENEASAAVPKRLGFRAAETVMGEDFPVEQQRWRLDLD